MYPFFISLLSDIRALPRAVFVIVVGQFINRVGCFVYPFLTLYLGARGYSATQIALVLGAMGVGNIVGPIASGYLADAIGRRHTIVLSLVSSAVLMFGIFLTIDIYPLLLLNAAGYGFANFLYGPASSALLTDLVPSEQRVIAYAMVRLAINGGFAVGPALGGLMYAYSPALIFIGDAATTLLYAGLAALWLPQGLRTVEGRVTSPKVFFQSWQAALRDVSQHRLFKQYLLSLVFMAIGFIQVFNVLAIASTDKGLSPSQFGIVMSLNGLLILLVEMPVSQLLKRFPPRRVLTLGFILMAVGLASFGFAQSFGSFILAMTLFTIGEIVALPIGMAYSSDLAPVEYRGRYLGLRGLTWGFGGLVASSGIWFYHVLGPLWWGIAGLLVLFAAAVIYFPIASSRALAPSASSTIAKV